jgi:hypothetical protein
MPQDVLLSLRKQIVQSYQQGCSYRSVASAVPVILRSSSLIVVIHSMEASA